MVLALLLVATTALLFTKGAAAAPGDSKAEALSQQYKDVTEAAEAETLAFLTVDYKNMDPLIQKVLDGATGNFKAQYAARQAHPQGHGPARPVGGHRKGARDRHR